MGVPGHYTKNSKTSQNHQFTGPDITTSTWGDNSDVNIMGKLAKLNHTTFIWTLMTTHTPLIITSQALWTGTRPSDLHQINYFLPNESWLMLMGTRFSPKAGTQYMKLVAEFVLLENI